MPVALAQRSMITANQAAAILEVDRATFMRFVAEGRFTTQTLPGMKPRYARSEVETFRDSCTVPAGPSVKAVTS